VITKVAAANEYADEPEKDVQLAVRAIHGLAEFGEFLVCRVDLAGQLVVIPVDPGIERLLALVCFVAQPQMLAAHLPELMLDAASELVQLALCSGGHRADLDS
jgi:hypothetical protein